MKDLRPAAALAAVAASVVVLAGTPVHAAPPSNDTWAGRTVIGGLPFVDTVDTTEATTDANDAEMNANCGAPLTDASVWYGITPASDTAIVAATEGSTYSAGLAVVVGTPGSFEFVTCGPGAVSWAATTGVNYSLVIFDYQGDGGGNGGLLELTVEEAQPPPSIDVTVDARGRFTRTGSALISGTVTCTGEAEFAFLEVQASQSVGRVTITGLGGTEVTCDGVTRPWTVEVVASNGRFAGGKAATVTFAVACGVFLCGEDFEERVVHLSGKS